MTQPVYSLHYDTETAAEREHETFAKDVMKGLSAGQKQIPAKYHYDAEGSRLFKRITELPEYYLTRCEIDALEINREEIAESVADGPVNIIEFGPGNGSKTRPLIEYFVDRDLDFRYVAVDISKAALGQLADDYGSRFPHLSIDCLVASYAASLKWLKKKYRQRNLVLFLGSSVGNFDVDRAQEFLRSVQHDLNPGDSMIVGFDLVKDEELIWKAYNDSREVTAAFNLNMLERINRELDGDFDTAKFRYIGNYDPSGRVVQSYLVSLLDQEVRIGCLGRSFRFYRGELIHTEDSHKYRESDIEKLAACSGFRVKTHLYDSRKFFIDSVWETGAD